MVLAAEKEDSPVEAETTFFLTTLTQDLNPIQVGSWECFQFRTASLYNISNNFRQEAHGAPSGELTAYNQAQKLLLLITSIQQGSTSLTDTGAAEGRE